MPPPLLTIADLALCLAPTADLPHTFVEHEDLKAILLTGQNHFDIETACDVRVGNGPVLMRSHFPVFTAAIGSRDPAAPAVGFFGGIHGLERIGTQVILHDTRALLFRLEWDELLHRQLARRHDPAIRTAAFICRHSVMSAARSRSWRAMKAGMGSLVFGYARAR